MVVVGEFVLWGAEGWNALDGRFGVGGVPEEVLVAALFGEIGGVGRVSVLAQAV